MPVSMPFTMLDFVSSHNSAAAAQPIYGAQLGSMWLLQEINMRS